MLGRGNQHGVNVLLREDVFRCCIRPWRAAVVLSVCGLSRLAVAAPEIAHSSHLYVVILAQQRSDFVELLTPAADPDVAEGEAFIWPQDAHAGSSGTHDRTPAS